MCKLFFTIFRILPFYLFLKDDTVKIRFYFVPKLRNLTRTSDSNCKNTSFQKLVIDIFDASVIQDRSLDRRKNGTVFAKNRTLARYRYIPFPTYSATLIPIRSATDKISPP